MRNILSGSTVIALLAFLYIVSRHTSSQTIWPIALLVIAGAMGAGYMVQNVVRQRRLHNWNRAAARIEGCIIGGIDEGSQEYTCTYVYSVNGTRQVGWFKFLDRPGRIEEIKAALVGEVISVLYNPQDYTKSIVEESQIKRWDVA